MLSYSILTLNTTLYTSYPQPLRTTPSLISASVATEDDVKSALKSFRSALQVRTLQLLLLMKQIHLTTPFSFL